ncbi:unnamed protein product [Fraxinus pennsylvanica]|uniref:UDP-glycosyltransferase n=1 Tax=Fraxinus pennsylvanica TaxID=56036 RepID=A0AAD1ZZR3_9LAMI|nr:unnamed protein product [Fraxinus pennsylvanica]
MAPNERIVVFPFMEQGHIIPFLPMALKLEQEKANEITFVNTALNIKKLQDYIPKFSNIRLVEIPFDSTEHGLPPNSWLIESSPSLKPAFMNLVSSLVEEDNGGLPLWIISDMYFAWSVEVSRVFGIFHAILNVARGYGMAVWHNTWLNLPHLKSNSEEFSLPGFPRGSKAQGGEEAEATLKHCMKWLDEKAPTSVFMWPSPHKVLRLKLKRMNWPNRLRLVTSIFFGFLGHLQIAQIVWLPEGLEERIKNSKRGLLLKIWAPQMEILSHKSVEELGVCVGVANGQSYIEHEDTEEKIELVMEGTEGDLMRRKAIKIMGMNRMIKEGSLWSEKWKPWMTFLVQQIVHRYEKKILSYHY